MQDGSNGAFRFWSVAGTERSGRLHLIFLNSRCKHIDVFPARAHTNTHGQNNVVTQIYPFSSHRSVSVFYISHSRKKKERKGLLVSDSIFCPFFFFLFRSFFLFPFISSFLLFFLFLFSASYVVSFTYIVGRRSTWSS